MHELELARIVEADRRRGIATSVRTRRPRYLDDDPYAGDPYAGDQAPVADASVVAARTAGLASAARACTASSRTSTGSSRP